ncbi:family 2 glycosyl hydrolase [Clohesyomyces aquaticus]|uniref:Beta-mannosidase B n=1 Tax=Clohesyomyces aquaticus TaxID=1231657 RepID=A0A1Y1Z3W8_9PLEO|nr:family 2 glycosyl hydrolase [Clohesyomyces aquaticus]
MALPSTIHPLNFNWTFKRGDCTSRSDYLPANPAPTEVHLDLLKIKLIENPFQDLNELSVRWIADEAWTYRTIFPNPPDHGKPGVATEMIFEGLDTFASVYLNGDLILESENMFVAHRVDVFKQLVQQNSADQNILEIVFFSARQKGLELVRQHPEHRFIVHQTETSRGPVRKAQYHWGWDWGPILMSCGPWKPVSLETYTMRIEDVWIEYELSDDLRTASGSVFARIEGKAGKAKLSLEIETQECRKIFYFGLENLNDPFEAQFGGLPIDLWWPRGYGPQHLCTVTATLTSQDMQTVISQCTKTIGFRKAELIQDTDAHGTSFYFRINNADIFAGGSCWIPADSFVTRLTPSDYRDWIKLAAEGNQIMIRVWGGGIYESEAFYEACNEFGILVWQDFMFACANYPAYPSYVSSIETEALQNVRRLRHHPSIVIWAGNNEDYQIVERYGLEYRFSEDKDPESWLKTNFPARYIYEYLLPKVTKKETKGVPYHPSSPFGNGTSTTLKVDPTVGDIHQWNLWHGDMKPYQKLPEMGGRFVSEFGMEAYPHVETLEKCITREQDRYPGSMAMDFRNKAIGHERRLVSYVVENFRIQYDLPGYTYLTQVMQADAMAWAYKSWRKQWGIQGKRQCGGVLVWQLNDCWPTMSWAVVDYHLVPKPAYYAIKRAMEPVAISVSRKFNDWTMRPADELWKRDTSHIDMRKVWSDVEFSVWVSSSRLKRITAAVVVKFYSIKSGRETYQSITRDVEIQPNGTTDIIFDTKINPVPKYQDPNCPYDISKADPFAIHASLWVNGKEVAADVSWPDPIKYLSFPDRGVEVKYSDDKTSLTVSAAKPVKAFVMSEKQGIKVSDNGFDIMPGENKTVAVEGIGADKLEWRYIDM